MVVSPSTTATAAAAEEDGGPPPQFAAEPIVFTAMEAAQVYATFQASAEKLALVGSITIDPEVQGHELSQAIGDEIIRVIQEQQDLEKDFKLLIQERMGLKNTGNKMKVKDNQERLFDVTTKLRKTSQLLSRNLKDNPNVTDNMAKVDAERQSVQQLLSLCLSQLVTSSSISALSEEVAEDEKRERIIEDTIQREKAASQAVKELKAQISEEREKHEQEVTSRKRALTDLKETLKEVKAQASIDNAYSELEMLARNKTEKRLQQASLTDLQDEIRSLKTRIEIEKRVHQQNVDFLQRKYSNMQEEALNWMQKHENDTQSKDKEIEILKLNHQRDAVKLEELEKKYKDELAHREKRDFVNMDLDDETNERYVRSALKIQALYRGYKARKEATPAKSEKKKGKKGKKKG